MPSDRRWSDADRELVAETLHGTIMPTGEKDWPPAPDEVPAYAAEIRRWAAAVLDALTAASWRPAREAIDRVRADERAQVAEEIAQLRAQLAEAAKALRAVGKAAIVVKPTLDKPYPDEPTLTPWTRFMEQPARRAYNLGVEIARAHTSTPEEDQDG